MEPFMLALVFFIGVLGAFMGSTVSGGGAITIPALIALGIPPHITLGTVRPSYLVSSIVAGWSLRQKGYVRFRNGAALMVPTFIGGLIGASLILQASETLTKYLIAAFIVLSVAFLFFNKESGLVKKKQNHSALVLAAIALAMGAVSGAIGVFGATLGMVGLILLEGFTMKEAIAMTSIAGVGNQIAALFVFAAASSIVWDYAIVMMVGGIVGAIVGTEVVHKVPTEILKPLFMVVSLLLVAKFLFF